MRALLLVVAVVASGCHIDAALEEFCTRRPAECVCLPDTGCCLGPGSRCNGGGCCPRYTCDEASDSCVLSAVRPALVAEPWVLSLHSAAAPAPAESTVRIVNRGPLAATALEVRLTGDGAFSLAGDDCSGRALQPSEACELSVRLRPATNGRYQGTLVVRESQEEARIRLDGRAATPLTVRFGGEGTGTVVGPGGASCAQDCELWLPAGEVSLTAVAGNASTFAGWSGGVCAGLGACTLEVPPAVEVHALFDGWLRVEARGGGGVITVMGAGPDVTCASCTVPHSGAVRLIASSPVGGVRRWGGDCEAAGDAPECALTVNGPVHAWAEMAPYNPVFVTGFATSPAALGGDLDFADAWCASEAVRFGISGTFRAYVHTSTRPAIERLGSARGWASFVSGRMLPFANTAEDLAAGRLLYPLPEPYSDARVIMGRSGPDVDPASETCNDWTDARGTFIAATVGVGGAAWERSPEEPTSPCDGSGVLYCLGIDHDSGARLPAPTRLAFLSEPWIPAGGLSGADAHCTAEANAAGHPGAYRAALPPRTVPDATFQRPDGVAFAQGRAPLNVTLAGEHIVSSGDGSTGGSWMWSPVASGGAPQPCDGFTTGDGTALIVRPERPASRTSADRAVPVSCATAQRLGCYRQ